ncbi:hypothetical protein ABNG03_19175 [Halorubrum sp. RMP-47]|uniref:Glycerophosphoryl diester phosphodiesterase membrane domain-containing protein n=1 Tax=Halorubrum miltondacostae TaxID=3076378 RepID=A0ABD5M9K9_9EURY
MDWHAVDALDRAVDATRRFLFPFEAVRWAKLAFLALAMAGGGIGASRATISPLDTSTIGVGAPTLGLGASAVGFDVSTGGFSAWAESVSPPPESTPSAAGALAQAFGGVVTSGLDRLVGLNETLLVAISVVTLLVALAFLVCSFAFRLAFYDALATGEVVLWRPFRSRFRQAVGLLSLLAGIGIVVATPVVAFVVAVGSASTATGGSASVPVLTVSAGFPPDVKGTVTVALAAVGVVVTLVGAAGSRLTFEFVAPAMVARDLGVIDGWRAVWTSLRGSWSNVVAYLLVHALVATGVRIVLVLAVAFVSVVVAAAGSIAVLFVAVPLGGVEAVFATTAGSVVFAAVLVGSVVSVVAVTLPVRLVTRTYLTAYEVSALAGIDPELAPLAPSVAAERGAASTGGG